MNKLTKSPTRAGIEDTLIQAQGIHSSQIITRITETFKVLTTIMIKEMSRENIS